MVKPAIATLMSRAMNVLKGDKDIAFEEHLDKDKYVLGYRPSRFKYRNAT